MATARKQIFVDPREALDPLANAPYIKNGVIPSISSKTADETAQALGEDTVYVNIPKDFQLTTDGHITTKYAAGAAKMPRSHAEHWYSKVMGVTIV